PLAMRAMLVREWWQSGVAYNPLSPRVYLNPYPKYAELRAKAPLHWSPLLEAWVATRYADVDAILRDQKRFSNDPRQRQRTRAAYELDEYFRGVIKARRLEPRGDLISALVATEEAGDKLTQDELLVMLRLLLIAGNETTTNLIGNGMLALLRYPDQLQKLRQHPDLMDTAVEEMLRYDTAVQLDFRTALEDVEIGGQRITKGQGI